MEKDVERWLGQKLKARGALYYKFVSPGTRGVPDRLVITKNGQVIFLEIKDDGRRATAVQRYQVLQLRKRGVPAFVIEGIAGAADFLEVYEEIEAGRYEV